MKKNLVIGVALAFGLAWRAWLGEWALIGWGLLAGLCLCAVLAVWSPALRLAKKLVST